MAAGDVHGLEVVRRRLRKAVAALGGFLGDLLLITLWDLLRLALLITDRRPPHRPETPEDLEDLRE